MHDEHILWAGTEASFEAYCRVIERGRSLDASARKVEEEEARKSLLEVNKGIGAIQIHGPLTHQDNWFNALLGITSYNDIRSAMLEAAAHPEVKTILLDIDSGGGAVSGVMDTASLIRLVNDRIKPVVAFTEGSMMSAAYWLGMSAGRTLASPTAAVGSIGVLSTHREVSEALKKEGINVTVLRAGKYKALANSFEPLSKDGREQIQKSLDALYDVFVGQVAAMRGKPEAWVDEHMAQGREFLGEEAVSAGLVDGITTYDALFAELTSQTLDTQEKKKQTPFQSKNPIFKGSDMKKAFSQIELAAISTLSSTDAQKLFAGEAELAPAPEAAAAAVPSADAPQAAEAPAPVPEAAAAGTETAAAPQPAAPPDAVVSLLREQLAEAQAALLSARVEAESMKKELAQSADSMQAFVRIAATSASNMSIALGGAALSESLPHSTLLAEHQRLETAFKEKFKVGGVAATDSGGAPNNVVSIDPLYRARMAAVRFGVKRET